MVALLSGTGLELDGFTVCLRARMGVEDDEGEDDESRTSMNVL